MSKTRSASGGIPREKPKLLIVEDDPGLQKQLKWCFDDYDVIAADNRTDAIAALRRFEPPVILQDLGLPPDPTGGFYSSCNKGLVRSLIHQLVQLA